METLPPPKIVPMPGVRRQLHSSNGTVYKLINKGELERIHIGTRAFVTQESIDRFIERRRAAEAKVNGGAVT